MRCVLDVALLDSSVSVFVLYMVIVFLWNCFMTPKPPFKLGDCMTLSHLGPGFFIAAGKGDFVTSTKVAEAELVALGYAIGSRRLHGEFGLYWGGNHVADLFSSVEARNAYAKSFLSKAAEIPGSMLAWWHL